MSSTLTFERVGRSFGGSEVLRDISLSVPASSCVALLGASGSGKSTLLRIASGLDSPSRGTVLVDGTDVGGVPAELRGIALVFQKPLLFPHLSVVDNVAFSARMSGVSRRYARAQAKEFLELVQLGDYARRMPGQLSGGQEQRVSLARALAANPRILLLDEPFSSLDSRLKDDMYELLDRIRSQLEPTIVLVTHDRREASVLADTIAVLDEGTILQHGPVSELHYRPAIRAVNRIMGGLNEVSGVVADGVHTSVLGRVQVQPGAADGPATLVVRQEAVRLTRAGASAVDGVVSAVKPLGAHALVTVRIHGDDDDDGDGASVDGGARIAVEMAGLTELRVGDPVGVCLPDGPGWVVNR
ncbi:ABC transporter ATP-binding protein [Arthrobacter tecti]